MSTFNAVLARNPIAELKSASAQTSAFSHYNNLSAQLPVDPKTGKLVSDCFCEQVAQCFENIKAIVEGVDHNMNDVVRLTTFVTDIAMLDTVDKIFKTYFPTYLPARTNVAVSALPMNAKVQIEALISNGVGTIPNAPQAGDLIKLVNCTHNAPIDPLSTQTVSFSHYNNLSAQLPIDPKTGRLVVGGIKEQTAQCLKNIKAILESIDVPVDDIVRNTIFVKNLADIDAVNEVYTRFFPDSAIARTVGYMPARTVVEVADLPMGALVQVEAVVSHGDGTPPQLIEDRHGIVIYARNTENAPMCKMSTQTVAFSHYNHISAQLPVDLKSGKLVEGGVKEQAIACFTHIKNIVESINHNLDEVVKVNICTTDISAVDILNEVVSICLPKGNTALRIVGVSNLPCGASVQIDAVVGNEEGTPPQR